MKRILLMVFRNILLVPYMWIKLCHRAAHPENYTLEEHVKFLKWIVFRANKGGNVKIEEMAGGHFFVDIEKQCICDMINQKLLEVQ